VARLRYFFSLLMAILREISDESAYQRHLLIHARPHSGQEWRHFSEERLRQKYQRARCC
jgi:hypothetical protein